MASVFAGVFGLLLAAVAVAVAGEPATAPGGGAGTVIPVLRLDGPIGPAHAEYVARGLAQAAASGAPLVVIGIDTPGGLASATRDIVREILSSPVPVAAWVAPGGARAASAGTYIVMASHVAAMAPATNIGAATPVSIGGGPTPGASDGKVPAFPGTDGKSDKGGKDDGNPAAGDGAPDRPADGEAAPAGGAMERKVVNDSAAWMRALAQARGRNVVWSERAVREGLSLSADEALAEGVVDFLAPDLAALLAGADGREVMLADGRTARVAVGGATTEAVPPDWRQALLMKLSDPTIAYVLLLAGAYAIFLEITTPGLGVAGVAGVVMLLAGAFGLQMLPLNYVGLALLVFGLGLVIAEAFVSTHGLLGLVGTAAFVIGSIMLIDTEAFGFSLPIGLIGGVAIANLLIVLVLARLALAGWRRPVATGTGALQGATGEVVERGLGGAWILVQGERWRVRSTVPLAVGQTVRVRGRDGLVLDVEPLVGNGAAASRPDRQPGPRGP